MKIHASFLEKLMKMSQFYIEKKYLFGGGNNYIMEYTGMYGTAHMPKQRIAEL